MHRSYHHQHTRSKVLPCCMMINLKSTFPILRWKGNISGLHLLDTCEEYFVDSPCDSESMCCNYGCCCRRCCWLYICMSIQILRNMHLTGVLSLTFLVCVSNCTILTVTTARHRLLRQVKKQWKGTQSKYWEIKALKSANKSSSFKCNLHVSVSVTIWSKKMPFLGQLSVYVCLFPFVLFFMFLH